MANKRPKPEEIVTKLRQVEVLTGQGMPRLDAICDLQAQLRQAAKTDHTIDRKSDAIRPASPGCA